MDWLKKQDSKIIQGSEVWHAYRAKHIGASEVPSILGVSPYKTIHQLFLEKTGRAPKFDGNFATRRGNELEPIARNLYNKKYSCNAQPDVEEHPEYKFLSASYDGIDREIKRVIEIKYAGKVDHQGAINGHVPNKYIPQVQTQLLVSGYKELDYISFDGEDMAVVRVHPDIELHKRIIIETTKFWELVQSGVEPASDIAVVENLPLLELLNKRESLKSEIDALNVGYEMINAEIKKLATQNCVCGPYEIKWTERKGAIDYEASGIDLEAFRKPPIRIMGIKKNG